MVSNEKGGQMNEGLFAQSEKFGMGTVISHKAFGEHAGEAILAAEKEVIRLEGMLSRFIPDSEISRINAQAGAGYEKVSSETFAILCEAVKFSKRSGCFDITIGPLVDLWKKASEIYEPPERAMILKTLSLVDHNDLRLDDGIKTAGLKRKGQSIDLGGIGKGYAAEKIIDVFKKHGIKSAFTNFGGNVIVLGAKPDGSPWRVGIQHPRKEGGLIGAVSVAGKSVVTSGDYQRFFFGKDGRRYHHLLDPVTGYPSESGLISATIISANSVTAEALSTILFVSGMKGADILKSYPGTDAILVDTNLGVTVTRGLEDCFEPAEDIKIDMLQD